MPTLTRREIVRRAAAIGSALAGSRLLLPTRLWSQSAAAPQRAPALPAELVREFVVAAHANLNKTKTMLEAEPHLINATWDWGGGDFETALGGASHMGRPDIAAYLLSNGARMDVFCATMMGKTDVVKACLADTPSIVSVKGPHGISLLRHAQNGKQDAIAALLTAAGAS